jgi:V/A-type H+-transporting ATPase subunit D
MEHVSPTRSELLTRKAQIALATQGVSMLRSKRQMLVREFIEQLRAYSAQRNVLRECMERATQTLMRAMAIDGKESLDSASLAAVRTVDLKVTPRNIWGTRTFAIESDFRVRTPSQRGYSAFGVSTRIDETAELFETAVREILLIAPMEHKMKVLAEDIRKVSRRVNALEQRMVPELNEQVQFIRTTLDQREREDIFRLKRLKGRKKRTARA